MSNNFSDVTLTRTTIDMAHDFTNVSYAGNFRGQFPWDDDTIEIYLGDKGTAYIKRSKVSMFYRFKEEIIVVVGGRNHSFRSIKDNVINDLDYALKWKKP